MSVPRKLSNDKSVLGMAHPHVAEGRMASGVEGSYEYIE
jgi:hypothetical protein